MVSFLDVPITLRRIGKAFWWFLKQFGHFLLGVGLSILIVCAVFFTVNAIQQSDNAKVWADGFDSHDTYRAKVANTSNCFISEIVQTNPYSKGSDGYARNQTLCEVGYSEQLYWVQSTPAWTLDPINERP